MKTVTQIAEAMQTVLGKELNNLAKEVGFIKRERQVTGEGFVRTLVLGWLGNPAATLEELSQMGRFNQMAITRQGLAQRFTKEAARFMHAALERCLAKRIRAATPTRLLEGFNGVYLLDSTVVRLPSAVKTEWAGCGSQESSAKVSVCWELQQGGLEAVHLHAGREHDQRAPMQSQAYPPGALRVADLGYFKLDVFRDLAASDAYWLTAYKAKTQLFDETGQALDLVSLLEGRNEPLTLSVQLGSQHRLPCRLIATPASPEAQQRHQAAVHEWERRKQQPASSERHALTAWHVYLTNAPAALLDPQAVLHVARLRWQIEQLFDLWKTHAHLDKWRSANPWRILCEFYAKLIALMLQHWILVAGQAHDLRHSLVMASQTVRKMAFTLAFLLDKSALLSAFLHRAIATLRAGCRISISYSSMPTFLLFDP